MLVDFHSHTNRSDGTSEPAVLLRLMRRRGVQVCSISDHDSLAAYDGLEVPGGLRIVTGVEINTTYRGNEVHVLGYGISPEHAPFAAALGENRNARRGRIEAVVTRLNAHGVELTLDAVMREAKGESLGRPHVAMALVRAGVTPTVDAAFARLLSLGKPGFVPSSHITPQRAIALIAEAGGVAVLAHPCRLRDETVIDELAEAGLGGLEVFYPAHNRTQTAHFRARARELGLVMTGGSDFHDAHYNRNGVGIEVDADDLKPFLDLVT
jgi:predicted metal-dependent phosphoesterase TrpH